jgi:hypothetical protein
MHFSPWKPVDDLTKMKRIDLMRSERDHPNNMEIYMSLSLKQTKAVRHKRARGAAGPDLVGCGTKKPLAQEILEDFASIFREKAFSYLSRNDETNFRYYADRAVQSAKGLAPYQIPKLAAAAEDSDREMVIVIKGGLPENNAT